MSELLPCPFCGSGWLYETRRNDYCNETPTMFCNSCKAVVTWEQVEEEGVNDKTKAFVREHWNSRAERTCRIAEYADAPFPVCSECGAVHELETALRKACEFIAGYGSCPYDTFDLYEPWEESCYQKCSADINRAECWRRYFERGGDAE